MLHSHTTLILAALMFLVLAALVWWTTDGEGGQAVDWWCAGSVGAGLGIVLMGLRPWISPLVSYQGANGCLLASMVLWAQALRVMDDRAWRPAQVGLLLLAGILYYSILKQFFEPDLRGMGMRAALGTLALHVSLLAWRLSRKWPSHNAAVLAGAYLALGTGLWVQLLLHGGGGMQPSPFSNTWDASVLALVALMTSALGHLCFAGMVLDRSMKRQVQATQVRAATQEMARLEAQLRKLDREDRLVLLSGSLAHELNQPLTAALTHAQVAQRALRLGKTDAPGLAKLLDKTGMGIQRASRILERIRAPAHARTVEPQRLDLREVARSTMDLIQPESRRMGLRIELSLGERPLWCSGDEIALSQVVINLLRNAMQAAQQGPRRRLQLSCQQSQGEVRLVIRDQGPGVAADVLARWGEPFAGTREHGLGLGLAISRAITQQHHGRLELRNHPEGGAEALLALPVYTEPDL